MSRASRYLPTPYVTKSQKKRDLMAAARRCGWRGKSYWSAKKFERKLERDARANG